MTDWMVRTLKPSQTTGRLPRCRECLADATVAIERITPQRRIPYYRCSAHDWSADVQARPWEPKRPPLGATPL